MRAGGGAFAGDRELEALVVDVGLAARYKDVGATLCTQGVVPVWIQLACVRRGRELTKTTQPVNGGGDDGQLDQSILCFKVELRE